ncbi:MAG: amidohydrolase family protein [Eubacterium sp.]|nr:amidohydrolase family protein [Eubacterium sp.]
MIIDFHTHIFPEKIAVKTIAKLEQIANVKACADGREESLLRSMESAGVDVSVVLPVVTAPEQFSTVNRFAASLNEKYEGKSVRILSFGGIHPDSPDYKKELRKIKGLGLQGIKLHPDYQGTYFDDLKYMRILDEASALGLVTVVHAGIDIGFPDHVRCTVGRICRVLDEVAPQKLVLAHFGGFRSWEEVERSVAGREVYLDTAYTAGIIGDEIFLNILKKHGANQILFATDSPWSGQAESLAHIRRLVTDEKERDQILGQNAQKLIAV